ncbi:TPM domain-containing protein [Undibacterium flavidum]|uniref:TPM domain-containing protein n=1 Tax=Undibacterium flavidum TaxID=2762297 RepID=A0ABR6Y7P9_9BURK|nr:TPM domain-containing protein [Undibacterium flavidum]MBC3872653.1 TPM domain-containing protein [Undibacterium flavidum]
MMRFGQHRRRMLIVLGVVALTGVITAALGFVMLKTTYLSSSTQANSDLTFPADGFINTSSDHQYDRALRSSLRFFQERTQIRLGLILQDHLPTGLSIEQQAVQRFATLGSAKQAALLLIWSEQEHLFKIEVSYQLEGVFPDALCRRLEQAARTFMLSSAPFAKRDFLTEVIVTMGIDYLDFQKSGQVHAMAIPSLSPLASMSQHFSGGAGIVGRNYAATLEQVQAAVPALSAELEHSMQPDQSLDLVLQRYFDSLRLGIGSPRLPLLSEGSQFFRMNKPHTAAYLQRMYRYYQKSMPYQIQQKEDLAVVKFPLNSPVQPILMRKNAEGLWLIDEAKAWAYFHLYEDGSSHPKFDSGPFAFAWRDQASVYYDRIVPPKLNGHADHASDASSNIKQGLQAAEARIQQHPQDAQAYQDLAEILQFDMYWIQAAAEMYEKALSLAPQKSELHWRLIDIYANTTDIDAEEKHYLALLKSTPDDALLKHYYAWFKKNYE